MFDPGKGFNVRGSGGVKIKTSGLKPFFAEPGLFEMLVVKMWFSKGFTIPKNLEQN